ncbi:SpoU rRNA Methylase family enzyme [Halalkaliarchaeum sp. AArc-CO]|uniref:tRNA (cytidine(56)-2'-O)-methyltransferase n=1 Tax=unclassified Halalkaliarchaeum TaxID=2678344 RepID=UPI00217CF3D2|nr:MULTISPECIES: tRNA (cytidine(56)-2'-O)-methyltransferase [unclassified Halalkaliarchaeum]MDR5671924.1 tRNA (cytidine(56)-2'-O)-methyltransferase [Halalkaliarchaeum sp. AArc-GB]UWG51428.1 SpoU rRNA Methylase family enzyme [Halalkaliarchaeum sp. AArc-CO]
MQGDPDVVVLRYGHRPGRDDRMTTHVGLTARALGADRVLFPSNATQSKETVDTVTDRFGGPFVAELRDDQNAIVRDWDGIVVHLTMYGEPIQEVQAEIRDRHRPETGTAEGEPILIVVGGEKVPFELYERADFNVGVTNQPHSEVAGLAVFLDRLFEGHELDREWEDADRRVVPRKTGKEVVPAEGSDDDGDDGDGASNR